MNALVGEVSPELYAPWNPIARMVALISFALLGVALWVHAALHPDSAWYVVSGESYSGLYELLGVMFIATAVVGSIPALIMPWQAVRATDSPLEITVAANELRIRGYGRHKGISKTKLADSELSFSGGGHLISNPYNLSREIEGLLNSLEIRLKPFVVIAIDSSGYSEPSPADIHLIKSTFAGCQNILDFSMQPRDKTRDEVMEDREPGR